MFCRKLIKYRRKSTGTKRGEVGAPREVPHAKQRAISEFDLREPRKWQYNAATKRYEPIGLSKQA